MKITETEMRGLITGKAMPADIFVGESLAAYLVRKFDEVKAQRDALASENAALKSAFLPENLPEEAVDAVNGTAQFDWDFNDCGSWAWVVNDDDVAKAVIGTITPLQTPATDAYLNAVRAEGVEMFAKHCDDDVTFAEPEDEAFYTLMEEAARAFAAQLRAGKDGE